MEPILLMAGVSVFAIAAMVAVAVVQHRSRVAAWTEVADRLGLTFDGKQIAGTLDEVAVRVHLESRGAGKSKTTYTVFVAEFAPDTMPDGLNIIAEHFLLKLGKSVGMQDVQLDLPGIDEKMMVRGSDEHALRTWAQRSDVSRALSELVSQPNFNYRLNEFQLTLDRRGALTDSAVVEERLLLTVKLARALSGKGYGALLGDGQW